MSGEKLDGEDASADVTADRAQKLDALGVSLATSRSAAMAAREVSGIEDDWEEDEEHYEGIDEINRGERKSWRGKPPAEGTGTTRGLASANSSTVFLNITRPYVDAASARIGDMLLPTDDRSWSILPTPIPFMVDMTKGKFPDHIVRQAAAEFPGQPGLAKNKLHAAIDQAVADLAKAKDKAEAAQKRIEDWHVQGQWHAQVRSVLEDTTKIGTGILKGPIPVKRKQVAFINGALIIKEEIQPASIRIDPWNFYPDPACGENIHNGSHCWERDDITMRGLMDLQGSPGYLDDQIDLVLMEGAMKATRIAPDRPLPDGHTPDKSGMFEIWYFHGFLGKEDLEASGCKCPDDKPVAIAAQVTMVNNRVIRAIMNPIDTGELPYDVMVWQVRAGHWAGIGVSRQVRTPQEIVNGGGRNLMDNAGRAGGPQLVIMRDVVKPHDGIYEITPWKIWLANTDADMQHLDKAFRFVLIPMMQQELAAIIELGKKLAEDITGLPMLLQGQSGGAPDTARGMELVNNNASTVLRRIARLFDDRLTEPHIRRYYAYLLMYGEDSEKGDFQIDARGSSALVQRDLEATAMAAMQGMVMNPMFGLDPKKFAEESLKAKHLDPKRFQYDDEEWQKVVAGMSQKPDPREAIAQLNIQSDEKLLGAEQAFEADQNAKDREQTMLIAQIDAELAKAGLTADQQKVLSEIKGKLGDTVIKIRAQAQMARDNQFLDLHKHKTDSAIDLHKHNTTQLMKPPTEPAGRAKTGQAWTQ